MKLLSRYQRDIQWKALKNSKKNVQNQTGSFVSDASIKDGKVIFCNQSIYAKNLYLPAMVRYDSMVCGSFTIFPRKGNV